MSWEKIRVEISVTLPKTLEPALREAERNDPEFLSRVILYGLTRRSIYRHLRENEKATGSVEGPPPPVPS